MKIKEKIQTAIFTAIEATNIKGVATSKIKPSSDTKLYGESCPYDSLGFVVFTMEAEKELEKIGLKVDLQRGVFVKNDSEIFKTTESFIEYLFKNQCE